MGVAMKLHAWGVCEGKVEHRCVDTAEGTGGLPPVLQPRGPSCLKEGGLQ